MIFSLVTRDPQAVHTAQPRTRMRQGHEKRFTGAFHSSYRLLTISAPGGATAPQEDAFALLLFGFHAGYGAAGAAARSRDNLCRAAGIRPSELFDPEQGARRQ